MVTQVKVLIMRGLPGSGKSTLAKDIATRVKLVFGLESAIVSADDHFVNAEGQYVFNPAEIGNAHNNCFRKFYDLTATSENLLVIVDNTNTTAMEIAPYVAISNALGLRYHILEVETLSLRETFERNTHGVTAETFSAMVDRMKTPLPPYWRRVKNPPNLSVWLQDYLTRALLLRK